MSGDLVKASDDDAMVDIFDGLVALRLSLRVLPVEIKEVRRLETGLSCGNIFLSVSFLHLDVRGAIYSFLVTFRIFTFIFLLFFPLFFTDAAMN